MAKNGDSPDKKPRSYRGPAFFSHGFRPFFFLAALYAALAIPAWMAAFSHGYAIGTDGNALGWHAHEMLFGYVAAVVAGFILTAIPNWTGRLPVAGWPLILLVLTWAAGRVVMFTDSGQLIGAIVDSLFLVAVASFAWREVISGQNWRNLPICLLISIFALSNIVFHAETLSGLPPQYGQRMGIAIVTILMMLIGGRVIPSFTTNWMKKNSLTPEPAPFAGFDKIAILVALITLLFWISKPDWMVTGYLFLLAALLHLIRLSRWQGWRTSPEPLVLILHIAYFWISLAFILMATAILRPDILTQAHALHALTAGAVAQLTMAVMTRASLGHCGRELRAGSGTILIYVLIFAGAVLRLILPLTSIDYALAMSIAGMFWAAGFLLFAVIYGPMLFKARR